MFVFKFSANLSDFRIIFRNDCQKRSKRFQKINYRVIRFFLENSIFYKMFWAEANKIVGLWPVFSAQFQNSIPRDQRETLRISTFFEKTTVSFLKSKLEEKNFGSDVETGNLSRHFFWGKLTPFKKTLKLIQTLSVEIAENW